jgi:hypothetical protein
MPQIELTHPLLNKPWCERHLRALQYLVARENAHVRELGYAQAGKKYGEMHSLGASKEGGRIVSDLSRLGLATIARPYKDARGYWRVTAKGRETARALGGAK